MKDEPLEIIGIVKDTKDMNLRERARPAIYRNYLQSVNMPSASIDGSLTLAVGCAGEPAAAANAIRDEIHVIGSTVPVSGFDTLAKKVDRSLLQERLLATLSSFFGALALLLACLGLYGVMSYNVTRRTGEIGIRMALGAQRRDVVSMVLREGLLPVMLGLAIGTCAALGIGRLAASQISGLLFGLSAGDASAIVAAILILTVVAALAALVPAGRASRVDPMHALRCE